MPYFSTVVEGLKLCVDINISVGRKISLIIRAHIFVIKTITIENCQMMSV